MCALKVIILILPAVAYCRISIRIVPGRNKAETKVDFSGSDTSIVSDVERKTFDIEDENLNRAVEKLKGKKCTDIYVKPPTKFGDVFEEYDFKVVKRVVKPVGFRIVGINMKPVAMSTADYINSHGKIPATYSTSLEHSVQEEVSHCWTHGGEVSVGQEITYSITVGMAEVGGTTSLSYTSAWGQEKTESRTVKLGTTSTISATVPPGEKVVATLTANHGKLEIDVYYEITLTDSHVFCNYEDKYEDHHFWAWPLWELQDALELPWRKYTTEHITVGFYSNVQLELSDGKKLEGGVKE